MNRFQSLKSDTRKLLLRILRTVHILRGMQIPNYVLRARRLNTPPELPTPPAPTSLFEVDRDAWVLQSYVKETRMRAFVTGTGIGIAASLVMAAIVAIALAPSISNSDRRDHAAVVAQAKPAVPVSSIPVSAQAPRPVVLHPAQIAAIAASQPTPATASFPASPVIETPTALPIPPMMPIAPAKAAAPSESPKASDLSRRKIEQVRRPIAEKPAPANQPKDRRKEEGLVAQRQASTRTSPVSHTPVLYAAPQTPSLAPSASRPAPALQRRAADWTLVGTPTAQFALIAVSGPGGQTVLPVRVGQTLPDGSKLEAIGRGDIKTSSGTFSTSH